MSFPYLEKQLGQYARTRCGCAATHPFVHVFVCFACASAQAKHTKTCITTFGRRRRPICTELCPYSIETLQQATWLQRTPVASEIQQAYTV